MTRVDIRDIAYSDGGGEGELSISPSPERALWRERNNGVGRLTNTVR